MNLRFGRDMSPCYTPHAGEGVRPSKLITAFLIALTITACSPKYDWREVKGEEAPFIVLMPDKPSHLSRDIQLGQQTVTMHMTASQIDDVKFAVGAIKMANPTEAQTALAVIKTTLVNNMAGKITQEKTTVSNEGGKVTTKDKFDAIHPASSLRMSGYVVARDVWVYEVIVLAQQNIMNQDQDAVDTFLDSFKPMN